MKVGVNRFFIVLFITCCTILSCSKPINRLATTTEVVVNEEDNLKTDAATSCKNAVLVTLRNRAGLDGCGWVLQLENGKNLEPLNLKQYANLQLQDGKKLLIEYEVQPMAVSICMIGQIVKITCLSEVE